MSFAIRKGVPLPPKTRGTGNSKYPLADLEIGDQFFIPAAKKATQVTLSKRAKGLGIHITTRKATNFASYDDEGNGVGDKVEGLAVWRIAAPVVAAA